MLDPSRSLSGITSRCLPSTSNICNRICCTAGNFNQPTNRELLIKLKRYMDLVQISRIDVSCHHGTKYLHGSSFFFPLKVYCYYYQEVHKSKFTVISTKAESAFSVTGFPIRKKKLQ